MDAAFKWFAPETRCYGELFVKHNFNDSECLLLLGKSLFHHIVQIALTIVFVPQILRLLWTRSSYCISFPAVLMETVALTTTFVAQYKNGAASTNEYRDSMLLVIQCAMLLFLVLACQDNIVGGLGAVIVYLGALTFLTSHNAPSLIALLQPWGGILILASRFVQTLVCFKEKSAGQMSTITWAILLYKATSGLFALVQIRPLDVVAMVTLITESALNGMILSQVMFSNMFYSHGQQKWKSS